MSQKRKREFVNEYKAGMTTCPGGCGLTLEEFKKQNPSKNPTFVWPWHCRKCNGKPQEPKEVKDAKEAKEAKETKGTFSSKMEDVHMSDEEWKEVFCEICGQDEKDKENAIIICDFISRGICCNKGYHMKCLSPPLTSVPTGRWEGPCNHDGHTPKKRKTKSTKKVRETQETEKKKDSRWKKEKNDQDEKDEKHVSAPLAVPVSVPKKKGVQKTPKPQAPSKEEKKESTFKKGENFNKFMEGMHQSIDGTIQVLQEQETCTLKELEDIKLKLKDLSQQINDIGKLIQEKETQLVDIRNEKEGMLEMKQSIGKINVKP